MKSLDHLFGGYLSSSSGEQVQHCAYVLGTCIESNVATICDTSHKLTLHLHAGSIA